MSFYQISQRSDEATQTTGHGLVENPTNKVEKKVDKYDRYVDKWKSPRNYTHNCLFIPSTISLSRSFVDSSFVTASTPCITVV